MAARRRASGPKRSNVSSPFKRETRNKLRRPGLKQDRGARMYAKVCTWRRQTFGAGTSSARSQNREKASALRRAALWCDSTVARGPTRQTSLQPPALRFGLCQAQNPGPCPRDLFSPLSPQPISWRASFGATPRARRDGPACEPRALSCARGGRPGRCAPP
jgi:hypothetical protein